MVPDVVKPKKFNNYDCHNISDCIALVPAMPLVDMWQLPRSVKAEILGARLVEGKDYVDQALEPAFSGAFLGEPF